nr:MAG TPA: hypothetical protein [Caudoviricetes sp.]
MSPNFMDFQVIPRVRLNKRFLYCFSITYK